MYEPFIWLAAFAFYGVCGLHTKTTKIKTADSLQTEISG